MPKITFVVPNYQGEKLLAACLDSVFSQETNESFEIIVVDDCSTDGSTRLIESSYPDVKVIVNRKNSGCAASKNVGAAQAQGEFIAFLDNDIELDADWVEAMLRRFETEGDRLGCCASHILINGYKSLLNSTGGLVNLLGYAWDRGIFGQDTNSYAHNNQVMWACAAAMIVRRSIFEEIGGFDSVYEYLFDDVDLGWRMNVRDYGVAYEPRAIVHHHQNTVQGWKLVRRLYLYERNRLRNLIKNMESQTLKWISPELRYHFLHRVQREFDNSNFSLPMRLYMIPRMVQALFWNAFHLRDTLRLRSKVQETRQLTDWQLMRAGVLCPFFGDPYIMEDPRIRLEATSGNGQQKKLPRRIVMSTETNGALESGWYSRELDVRGVYFRWMEKEATLHMKGRKGKRYLVLHTLMSNPTDISKLSVSINGQPVSSIEVPNYPNLARIELPPGLEAGDWKVELRVDNTFSPRDVLGIEDYRKLGVAIAKVELS
ncbi:MAG: hypothetical protein A2Y75_08415 [Candidatus Solincola sediminis]|uniref:Glycosyltransferase 2-like domain-containing protein n=1 Tax=Candidatus Solincola sediminis TaxID=1797199 RepID=A0A1F2WLL2_9ACTN|nr:MAG: hypothetical protein A2Y75_08415 [Candidatus Solincola sediminis]